MRSKITHSSGESPSGTRWLPAGTLSDYGPGISGSSTYAARKWQAMDCIEGVEGVGISKHEGWCIYMMVDVSTGSYIIAV